MNERINHVANAERLVRLTDGHRERNAHQAQVHAILALVAEQRIANRIALAVAIRGDLELRDSATELSDWLNEGNGVIGYFSEAEQQELGIG